MPIPERFRSQCRLLRAATLVVIAGLCLMLGLSVAVLSWQPATAGSESAAGTEILLMLVQVLPAVGYLWALWAVQRALGDVAAGRMFSPTVARAMRHMGVGVLAGALFNVFLVTNLSRWIAGGQGSYLYFDLSGIVLGVVGAALILLARLVDQARALQVELDGIV